MHRVCAHTFLNARGQIVKRDEKGLMLMERESIEKGHAEMDIYSAIRKYDLFKKILENSFKNSFKK